MFITLLMLAVLFAPPAGEPINLWCRPQLDTIERLQKQRRFDGSARDERITKRQMRIIERTLGGVMNW